MVSLTCVSASDEMQTDEIAAMDDNLIEEEIVSEGAKDVGTFTELTQELNSVESGNKIELTRDYTYNPGTDSNYKYGAQMNVSNLEIDGKGHTLSGNYQARILKCNRNYLTIRNTVFTESNGTALDIYTYVTLINCTFINNKGSGISTYFADVINCTFINNTKYITICGLAENCTFINNTGGALHTYYESIVRNCTFENNTAQQGGALNYDYPVRVENCRFINNKATTYSNWYNGGGAISKGYDDGGTTYIINSTFINNTAPKGNSFILFGDWEILNSTFINSSIDIDNSLAYSNKKTNAKIEYSSFIDCNLINRNGNLSLSKNKFENSYVENNGTITSLVYFIIPDYAQSIENTLILLRVVDDNGNSIYDARVPENLISVTIENEAVSLDEFELIGGNWYYTTSSNLDEGNYNINISITDSDTFNNLFLENTVNNGILEVGDFNNFASLDSEIASAADILTLTKNYVIDITSEFDYMNGIVIDKNNLVIDGAGHTINAATVARIFNITGEKVALKNINFINGFGDNGGAIFSSSDITIENCTFTNNKAFDGGAVYAANANIKNSTFTKNIANQNGGAAYLIIGNITNSTFTENKATDNGGALYFMNKGNIETSEFTGNRANSGGAAYFENEASIKDSEFNSNTAVIGGAAYVNGKLNMTNATFTENSAEKAGALYLLDCGNITDSQFNSNNAERGLAIINGALLNISNTTFNDQSDENCDNEIILIRDGSVVLNNVTPKELYPIFCVDLYIRGNVSYIGDYNGNVYTYDIATRDVITYLDHVLFDIAVMNEENPLNHGSVIMSIGNANYTIEVIDGHAIMPMPLLDVGTHTITFTYNGGANYQKAIAQKELTVNQKYTRISVGFDPNAGYIASLSTDPDDTRIVGEELIFNIDNIINVTSTTNNDGVAVFPITPSLINIVGPGEKYVYISFIGNNNLYRSSSSMSVNIPEEIVIPPAANEFVNVNGDYSTTIIDDSGRPVVGENVELIIGDTSIGTAVTDANGIVTFHIPEDIFEQLKNGTAIITLNYNSNGYPHTIDKNITVIDVIPDAKSDVQITASNANYVINYGGTYSITLKDASKNALEGKHVTFILNGKNIGSAVTNAKGVASIKLTAGILKAAKAGSRNLIVNFNGDATYNAASKTVKISIKKEKTKITAKKKTFKKAKKVKKYTITLKNSKGKAVKKAKVTLKIKGKTYKAKTNSKGKATFKIKKLTKKGTYKAKIAFKATAYYLKSSKKVKIKIK